MVDDSNNRTQKDNKLSELNRRNLLTTTGAIGFSALASTTVSGDRRSNRGSSESDDTYMNPVYEPIFADPSIIRAPDRTFYAYGTQDASPAWNCDDAAIPILRSDDLIDWEYIGDVFEEWPNWKDEGFLWSPDIARHRGRYHVYYSFSEWGDENPGIGVATADSPDGPFEDHGKLFLSDEIGVSNSIDPQFFVERGTPYLIWGSWHGIHGVELSKNGLDWKEGTKFLLAGNAYEAPYVFERNGYYYLFVSTGSCCDGHDSSYEVEVGRSESFFGPYYNENGVDLREINQWNTGDAILTENERFSGPGHNSVVVDDAGTEWILYHAYVRDAPEFECGVAPRRSMMIDELTWSNGYPRVENNTPSLSHDAPIIKGRGNGPGRGSPSDDEIPGRGPNK